jgi:two-component system OmpR family sensor kinase
MSRVPTRLRLTLVFAVTMLLVLVVTGLFVYLRFRSELDRTINQNLHTQAEALLPLLGRSEEGLKAAGQSAFFHGHESFVQVLDSSGRVLAATSQLRTRSLLTANQLQAALRGPRLLTRAPTPPLTEGSRLLITPATSAGGGRVVLIVGSTLDERDSALSNLAVLLAIVGPIALIIASGIGYGLASAALAPVELMRRRAAAVSASNPGRRLPLPAADDEVRRLGSTLNEMLDRLEESMARERSFVANASHELRTPLATLKTELDLALRRERSVEELRDALRSADADVDRLSALADDLLVLARADEGRLSVHPAPTDVAELLHRVRDRFDPAHEHVRVIEPGGLTIVADRERLEQALDNLVENAGRYGSGEIRLSASPRDGGVELHVCDDGPGFPASFIDRAFERFTRADPGRGGPGAGLGLSIVRTIAQGHGGDAGAANRPSGGADVWIFIPAAGGDRPG